MHAALVTISIDPSQAPAAAAALMDDILPRVTSAPGFTAGYWLEPHDGQGFSILLFDTEEQTRQSAEAARTWSAPGVSVGEVEIRRVAVAIP
jgi:hypothetical protein